MQDIKSYLGHTSKGDNMIKHSKLHKLTCNFENLKMQEYKNISKFIYKILAIANEFYALGKYIFKEEICEKILKLVYLRYNSKILAIEKYAEMFIIIRVLL